LTSFASDDNVAAFRPASATSNRTFDQSHVTESPRLAQLFCPDSDESNQAVYPSLFITQPAIDSCSRSQIPTAANDHDFRSNASHIAAPYGILDVVASRGHVLVGTSFDTPAFSTDCISTWWKLDGSLRYPEADKLLILADNGGSNGPRCTAWKHGLK
jgi:Rhodopirellula transposase DDE domain